MKPQIAIIAPYEALKGEARAAVEELGLNILVREGGIWPKGSGSPSGQSGTGWRFSSAGGEQPWGFTDYGKQEKSPKPINCKPGSDRFAL